MSDIPAPAQAAPVAKAAIKPHTKTLRVRAKGHGEGYGVYGLHPHLAQIRRDGDIFEVWEEDFSPAKMEVYTGPDPASIKDPKAPVSQEQFAVLAKKLEDVIAENAQLRAQAAGKAADKAPGADLPPGPAGEAGGTPPPAPPKPKK